MRKRNPATRYKKITDSDILEYIEAHPKEWNISQMAKNMGVSRQSLYNHAWKNPKIKDAIANSQELRIDFAESKLDELIKKGNVIATIFLLKTVGRRRGYIEKTETEITQTKNIETIKLIEIRGSGE